MMLMSNYLRKAKRCHHCQRLGSANGTKCPRRTFVIPERNLVLLNCSTLPFVLRFQDSFQVDFVEFNCIAYSTKHIWDLVAFQNKTIIILPEGFILVSMERKLQNMYIIVTKILDFSIINAEYCDQNIISAPSWKNQCDK